ncbi:alpha-L-rhamnosidase [Agrocybe pediades]|nr:alpha-L-rhamnosidase [Agrocybe pediades]
MRTRTRHILLELFLITAALVCLGNALSLSSLLVENKVEPLGIDVVPRFSWTISSTASNDSQKSYRIRVSKSSKLPGDVWDSGVVQSKKSYLNEYGGPSLASDTKYFWTVDVTTSAGSTSASSTFATGMLSASDWGSSQWIGKPTNGPPDDLVSSFHNASWIWTAESNPPNAAPGDSVFRTTYSAPNGKQPQSATILMTADDQFTLYMNGNLVGASPTTANVWMQAQSFNVSLSSSSITFAVRATNLADVSSGGDSPAGLLAAIKIIFADGTSTTLTTDSSWLSNTAVPSDWNSPTFNQSGWTAASVIAAYGQGPWSNQVTIPTASGPTSLSFASSQWIWSSDATTNSAPAGSRAFRKTFAAEQSKAFKSALIDLTVDNDFQLYVNGDFVGSPPNETDVWKSAQTFTVDLSSSSTSEVVFAVLATNLPDPTSGGPSPAGLLGVIQITYTDGTSTVITSDTSWKVSSTILNNFQSPSFNDSAWPSAISLGTYGPNTQPWTNQVSISNSLVEHPAPLLRKEFNVNKPLSFARLYYAAGGYASITINGAPASDHVLTPGFTKYDTEMQYVALDVASQLHTNANNVIGAELGRSHFGVTQGNVWNWDQAPWHGEPRVRMVLSLGYTDGSTSRVVSDGSWKVKEGPTRLDDVFGGENFDASFIQQGFDTPTFDASSWDFAAIMSAPTNVLVNALNPPTRVIESLTPVNITQPTPGVFVAHFARVVAGWVKLTAMGPKKTLITIHFGEKLNDDGTVIYQDTQHYYQNNFQTDRFWLAGTGKPESFEPKFSYKGYQYAQIEGWPSSSPPPTPADVIGRVVHDDLQPRGGFHSSDDLLNKMHQASVFTMLNNVHSIPTDCPTFEKNGWSGDAMLGTEMFLLNFDSQGLLAKYVRDLDESRPGPVAAPAVIAPDSGWGVTSAFYPSPTWHSAFIFIPWWIYQYRGDVRVLQDHYTGMKGYIQTEFGQSQGGIASSDLGDWDTPETSPLGGNPPEDSRVPATAFLYQMLTVMSQVASTLNQTSDASLFSSEAQTVKNAFNSVFLNSTTGYYVGVGDSGYRQTHNILSLAFGLVPNASVTQHVADSIANDINQRGTHLNTGALGTKHLLPVLSDFGHADVAFAVAQQTTFPSWGYWIENGATTMWEHWLLTARSHDHLFLGTFEDWLYKYVAGIQMTSVAFETVSISLAGVNGPLTSANAWLLIPQGNLTVQWVKKPTSVVLTLGVPVGVEATILPPSGSPGFEAKKMVVGSGSHELTFSI